MALPVAVPAASDRTVAVVAAGGVALLLVDDGARAEVWAARGPWGRA
ncbi:hypothetical protein B0E53_04806 [Micromonospora sp. MH33]|nr:hypothetical protein B0E53_04806 [Micromonospora sp. MH33]